MKRVLLAGGAGFLGSHLTEQLLCEGFEVTVVDDFSSGRKSNLASVQERIKVIEGNIASFSHKTPFDFVLNFASRASRAEWEAYPTDVSLANSVGSYNLIRIALESKARYLYASSSEVYGDPEIIPTPETYVGKTDSVGPRSPYVESKRFGETLLKSFERQYGLDGVIIRLFNTYGPRMRGGDFYGRVIDRFIGQACLGTPLTVYGDGSQTRAFTYVEDTVAGVITVMKNGVSGEVYNIGSDHETRIIDLARSVIRATKSNSTTVFSQLPRDDAKRRAAEISKVKKLGWLPRVDLETGLRRTVGWVHNLPA